MSNGRRRYQGKEFFCGLLAVSLLALGACGGDGNGDGNGGDTTGPSPTLGAVLVAASTSGADTDPDGYSVTLDGGSARPLGVNAAATFADVTPGGHSVELSGVAANCEVQGNNPRNVSVTGGSTAEARFAVTCTALPPGAASLAFTAEPGDTELHQPLAMVEVTILDEDGNPVPGATDEVTVTLGANPGGGTLSGTATVSAVDGVARFDDLALDQRGSGYTLVVDAVGLQGAESGPFDVTFAWAEVTVGAIHTCGLTPSGVAYCWGLNSDGQLGDGNAGVNSDVPVAVATGLRFVQLSAGSGHTCGVTPSDEVHCWGSNFFGQLGDGRGGSDSDTPRRVEGGPGLRTVSAGGAHTCGLTISGNAYCWGLNGSGELGDGNAGTDSDLPVAVNTNLTFSAVRGGGFHTCALSGTDVFCWGDNRAGGLGDSTLDASDLPVLVRGGHTFVEVGAGSSYSCALTLFNEAFCWGENGNGQLGDGNGGTNSTVPVQVTGAIVFQVPSLSVGSSHTCAKRSQGGGTFCWGANGSGQLGDGSPGGFEDVPVAVDGGLTFSDVDAGIGSAHTCGVTAAGDAFCWGSNSRGQLGDGNAGTNRDTPVSVLDPP